MTNLFFLINKTSHPALTSSGAFIDPRKTRRRSNLLTTRTCTHDTRPRRHREHPRKLGHNDLTLNVQSYK